MAKVKSGNNMKIGIFDSGLGGLLIAKAIKKEMPEYDYVYLGDTKRVPYGNRSHDTVYEFTRQGIKFLFKKENGGLIKLGWNTAGGRALRKRQQEYLPKKFPGRRVLGVIIPVAEEVENIKKIGVLGTEGTVNSGTFLKEIKKLNPRAKIYQVAAPLLLPLVENEGDEFADPIVGKCVSAIIN